MGVKWKYEILFRLELSIEKGVESNNWVGIKREKDDLFGLKLGFWWFWLYDEVKK